MDHLCFFTLAAPVLVVSSADAARECKTHDLDLAYRPKLEIVEQLYNDMKSLISSPYGEYWRQARNHAFGRKNIETEAGKKFVRLISEGQEFLTNLSIGGFVPWLSWINILNGLNYRTDMMLKQGDKFLDELIQEHLSKTRHESKENLLDIAGVSIDMDGIKGLIKDVFGAGTDTTSAFLKWTMTELLKHPTIMKKLQSEVRGILHDKLDITFDDREKMHYLKAVIKETFRYHPPVPLIPREAGRDVKIMGYDIAAGTMVIINALAIGRDPLFWDEPEKFKPERFLNSSIDFKGLHFQHIPFGSGRRSCPGIDFATALIELVLANILHKFDWELPDGAKGENLDTTELRGLAVGRKNPLLAVAIPQ
ncbi:Cytochrome [Forsythia ovata]|uniref:Cytochrome n=1 Tax=Forsythia ovata TaxID=205694 RepID=A0ABD1R2J6_9LAMI